MTELPFHLDWIRFLADHRTELLTSVALFFTYLGDLEGYVLLITLLYVAYDKALGFRLAVLTLVMMSLNHLVKIFVMNPRPFVVEGSYAERWAVPADAIARLATEYSTPSGHGMAGAAFFVFLYASVRKRWVRIACIPAILLTGLSRPVLGVHYVEDVVLGWIIGATLTLFVLRWLDDIGRHWGRLSAAAQVATVVAASVALCLVTLARPAPDPNALPLAYLGYTGFLLGIVAGRRLETERIDFDPRSATAGTKALRWALAVALVVAALFLLDEAFEAVAEDRSALGYVLRYARHALAGFAGAYVAPLLFVRFGLASAPRQVPAVR